MGKKNAKKKSARAFRANPSGTKRKPKKAARRAVIKRGSKSPLKHTKPSGKNKARKSNGGKPSKRFAKKPPVSARFLSPRAKVNAPKVYQNTSESIRRRTKVIAENSPEATIPNIEKVFNRAKRAARKRTGPRKLLYEYAYIYIAAQREEDEPDDDDFQEYVRVIVLTEAKGEKIGEFEEYIPQIEETIAEWVSGERKKSDFANAKLILKGVSFDRLEIGLLSSPPKKRKKRAKSRRIRHRSK